MTTTCKACDNSISEQDEFCMNCGTSLNTSSNTIKFGRGKDPVIFDEVSGGSHKMQILDVRQNAVDYETHLKLEQKFELLEKRLDQKEKEIERLRLSINNMEILDFKYYNIRKIVKTVYSMGALDHYFGYDFTYTAVGIKFICLSDCINTHKIEYEIYHEGDVIFSRDLNLLNDEQRIFKYTLKSYDDSLIMRIRFGKFECDNENRVELSEFLIRNDWELEHPLITKPKPVSNFYDFNR